MVIDSADTSQPLNGEICMDKSLNGEIRKDKSHILFNNPARQKYRYTSAITCIGVRWALS
jgi:hypothetical protein